MNEREKILDEIIKIFGFESLVTITFAHMIENSNYTDNYLRYMSEIVIEDPEEWTRFCEKLSKAAEELEELVSLL